MKGRTRMATFTLAFCAARLSSFPSSISNIIQLTTNERQPLQSIIKRGSTFHLPPPRPHPPRQIILNRMSNGFSMIRYNTGRCFLGFIVIVLR